mmetsp:Transcript_35726/g.47137  ORF Transcript_35726/g.47137 Transcript_35726/m.47137 type:complete len:310 (+) Transcript_35726:44-973(+)
MEEKQQHRLNKTCNISPKISIIWDAKDLHSFTNKKIIRFAAHSILHDEEKNFRYCAKLDQERRCLTTAGYSLDIGKWSFLIQETRCPTVLSFILNGSKMNHVHIPINGLCECCRESLKNISLEEMSWVDRVNNTENFVSLLSEKCSFDENFQELVPSIEDVTEVFGNIMKDLLLDGIPVHVGSSKKRASFSNAFLFINSSMEEIFYVIVNSSFSQRKEQKRESGEEPIRIKLKASKAKESACLHTTGKHLIKIQCLETGKSIYLHALSKLQHKVLFFGLQILSPRSLSPRSLKALTAKGLFQSIQRSIL